MRKPRGKNAKVPKKSHLTRDVSQGRSKGGGGIFKIHLHKKGRAVAEVIEKGGTDGRKM